MMQKMSSSFFSIHWSIFPADFESLSYAIAMARASLIIIMGPGTIFAVVPFDMTTKPAVTGRACAVVLDAITMACEVTIIVVVFCTESRVAMVPVNMACQIIVIIFCRASVRVPDNSTLAAGEANHNAG